MNHQTVELSAGLYLVATPIGSARDITLRALDVLASADVIAAEDTRTARKLMDIHGVKLGGRPVIAFHDHSGDMAVSKLVARMSDGQSVAYVSEAGTPLIADPGYELGRAAAAAGVPVHTAPGPSAVIAALSVSGLPTDRFAFVGFLPATRSQRKSALAELKDVPFTLVFYESPKRIHEMLADCCDVFGADRAAVVCRELTKRFEEVRRGSLTDLCAGMADQSVRGEIVVLIDKADASATNDDDIVAALTEAMETMRIKDAATTVAGALNLPRRQVYQIALGLGRR